MNGDIDLLQRISIAKPCPALWKDMVGDDRERFCSQCRLSVYNIADMTAKEAADLIREKNGHLCVQLFRRQDGTVLTTDCPVGLRAVRRHVARVAATVLSIFVFTLHALGWISSAHGQGGAPKLREFQPFARVYAWLSPAPRPTRCSMGEVALTRPIRGRVRAPANLLGKVQGAASKQHQTILR